MKRLKHGLIWLVDWVDTQFMFHTDLRPFNSWAIDFSSWWPAESSHAQIYGELRRGIEQGLVEAFDNAVLYGDGSS